MSKISVLGVYRLPLFSNNAIEADRMILSHAMEALNAKAEPRLDIDFVEEPEVASIAKPYDLVLTMAQSAEALATMDSKAELLPTIWNSTAAVRNCYRKRMSEVLGNSDVGYAPYSLVNTKDDITKYLENGSTYWLKRGDFHAISDDDVSLAETALEARIKMQKFADKGVSEVVLQRHIVGDIYKFYGVSGGFFSAIRVRQFLTHDVAFDEAKLRKNAEKAASTLGLLIFGGDCILDEQGGIHIIDLNDWPSFRICRENAANAIGSLAASFINKLAAMR